MSLFQNANYLLEDDGVLEEGNSLFVIFKDNEPFEVVGSRKEAKANVEDYKSHRDSRGAKFDILPYKSIAKKLEKTKPNSYKKLQSLKATHGKLSNEEILEEQLTPMTGDGFYEEGSANLKTPMRRSIGNGISKLGNYHKHLSSITSGLLQVFEKNNAKILFLGTVWDGMFTGKLREGETFEGKFEIAIDDKEIKNSLLICNIYRMKNSYELNAYLS